MNAQTLELPAWHRQFNPSPTAHARWIRIKLSAGDRQTLIDTQGEWDRIMSQRSGKNPLDEAKSRWRALRDKYDKTRDATLLKELDLIGYKGRLLEPQLRDRLHQIRAAARKIALEHNCAPIYATVFELASQQVLARIRDTERAEIEANQMLENYPYRPSELLAALANLAAHLKTQATIYSDFQGEALQPPGIALELLWPAIVNSKGTK